MSVRTRKGGAASSAAAWKAQARGEPFCICPVHLICAFVLCTQICCRHHSDCSFTAQCRFCYHLVCEDTFCVGFDSKLAQVDLVHCDLPNPGFELPVDVGSLPRFTNSVTHEGLCASSFPDATEVTRLHTAWHDQLGRKPV